MDASPNLEARPTLRRSIAWIIIVGATAQSLGTALRMPTQLTANDISRYCTVWSLLERGTYAIDDCPWQKDTQDKVQKPDPFGRDLQTPEQWKRGNDEPPLHFYSSKPPLLATMMAGVLYPFRANIKVPLDGTFEQKRVERNVQKAVPGHPGQFESVKETPPPVVWQAYLLYFKPAIILFNVVPYLFFLIYYARLLDRYAANDWAWTCSLMAGAFGTLLLAYNSTFNNHSVAAFSAFFAAYAWIKIEEEGGSRLGRFAVAGFFAAFCACNEIPAGLFALAVFLVLVVRYPKPTLLIFGPAALVPLAAFFGTQYLAFGQFRPVYEEFGTKAYTYEGSYWNTPLEYDYFNLHPESKARYLFHMTFGHHGVFSLTPVFLFSIYVCVRNLIGQGRPLRAVSAVTLILTVAMLAFYTWNPKARNYGGSTQGLRWLFWMIPLWLVILPAGLEGGETRKGARRLALAALGLSMVTVGYAIRVPLDQSLDLRPDGTPRLANPRPLNRDSAPVEDDPDAPGDHRGDQGGHLHHADGTLDRPGFDRFHGVAEERLLRGDAPIGRPAAEADPERPGHRGFSPGGVGAGVVPAVAPADPERGPAALADQGGGQGRSGAQASRAGIRLTRSSSRAEARPNRR